MDVREALTMSVLGFNQRAGRDVRLLFFTSSFTRLGASATEAGIPPVGQERQGKGAS